MAQRIGRTTHQNHAKQSHTTDSSLGLISKLASTMRHLQCVALSLRSNSQEKRTSLPKAHLGKCKMICCAAWTLDDTYSIKTYLNGRPSSAQPICPWSWAIIGANGWIVLPATRSRCQAKKASRVCRREKRTWTGRSRMYNLAITPCNEARAFVPAPLIAFTSGVCVCVCQALFRRVF